MKKRILSLLLLVAMILTMVPVMVSAEEAATESEQIQQATNNEATADTTPGDLHDWYIKDGLTALYSTFGADNGVNLTDGTWTSRVGTGVATLGTKARWSAGEFGGIGYTVLYGTVAEDGSYVEESSYNNQKVHAVMLDLGKQLPTGDYTVEYFAMYKPYYVADAEGNILVKDGAKVQSYDAFEGVLPGGCTATGPIERFGVYAHYTYTIDGQDKVIYNTTDMRRGYSFFCFDNPTWYAGGNARRWRIDNATRGVYHLNDVLDTYSITLDEMLTVGTKKVMVDVPAVDAEGKPVLDADGNPTYVQEEQTVPDRKINAKFSLFRGATAYHALSPSTTKKGESSYYDPMVKTDNTLYLAAARPADFFGVRVYDRALTISELRQNRAVDILLHYGIALDASVVANAAAQKAVCGAIYDFEIVTDATAKAAKKAELETLVAKALENAKIIGLYAAPESMTSFFTIYVPDSINLATGKWADLIGGDAASFGKAPTETEPSRWFKNADGSVGSNTFAGYVYANGDKAMAGEVNTDKANIAALGISIANHAYWKNNGLIFGNTKLPTEDFTVEYMAMYRPYLVADADKSTATEVVYARDAEGNLIEAYELFGRTPATTDYGSPSGRPVDSIGDFTTLTQQVDSTSGWGGSIRGTQHWMYRLHHWGTRADRNWMGTAGGWGKTSGLANAADTFKHNDVIKVYGVSLDETDHADDNTSILFTLYRDANKYASADGISWADTNANKYYTSELSSAAEFYLSGNQPTDFYGVRIYNKALSNAEKAQNVAADLILYYGIELDAKTLANAELMEVIYTALSTFTFEKDEAAKAAKKVEIEAAIADAANRLAVMTLYTLYVQDGLVGNFTALSAKDMMASVESGAWANRVAGGTAATMGNKQYWHKNSNGSVGFNIFYGGVDANGTYNTDSSYNNYAIRGTRLEFGIGLLPKNDFTVEMVAQINPVYAADAYGNPAGETYLLNGTTPGSQQYGDHATTPIHQLGYFQAWTTNRDGVHGGFSARGAWVWTASTAADWGGACQWHGLYGDHSKGDDGNAFPIRGSVHTYTITRGESMKDVTNKDGEVQNIYNAEYTLRRDTVKFDSINLNAVFQAEKGDTKYTNMPDFTKDDTGYFYLSERISTDFYAVRVYNRVLSVKELQANHLVDIIIYYGLEFNEKLYDKDMFATAAVALASAEIVTDASAKAANRALYQAKIDSALGEGKIEEICDYTQYYAQNGLVALYTAFAGDETADVLEGVWHNRVEGGKDATFKGSDYWNKKTEGVGYSMTIAAWNAANKTVGIDLPAEFEALEDFTVETFAKVEGITNADGSRYVNVYTPAVMDGDVEITPASGRQHGVYAPGLGTFRFGALNTLFFNSLDNNASQSLAQRWYFSNEGYPDGKYTSPMEHFNPKATDQSWRLMGPDNTPTAGIMQVTKETTATDVTYRVGYDASETLVIDSTITLDRYNEVAGGAKTNDSSSYFSLFNGLPATVYAIRVYDRVLTQAEKEQNAFVDKAAYFRIDLTGFENLDEDTQDAIIARFATISTNTDISIVQAIYNFMSGTDNESLAGKVVSFGGYAPILAGASGYRVLFNVNTDSRDLFESMGYTVTYGALVAPGGNYNAVEDVTIDNEDAIAVSVNGPYGTNVYYNLAGAEGYKYSIAVTSSDSALYGADMIVRGYVALTDADGKTQYVYVDIYENETLDGEVSILTAADYFVNKFDGDIATQYKYMNSAALRAILAECGVAGRVALEDDLAIFVDAENGSDENNGLSADNAYATLEAAMAAAKAHLGKPGIKNVVINLAAGEYSVTETLKLTAADILADEYSFRVTGQGDETVINALTTIDNSDVLYDDNTGAAYVQLEADANGEYPALRAVFGDGEMLTMAHFGDAENLLGKIDSIHFVGADGNILVDTEGQQIYHVYEKPDGTKTTNDWALTSEGAKLVEYAVFNLPLDDLQNLDESAYAGAELHFTQAWTYNVSVIDHVEFDYDAGLARAYVVFSEMAQSMYEGYNVKGQYFWFENSFGFINENADTYYYDREDGKLYFYEENYYLDSMTVAYSPIDQLFAFDGVNNITFEDLVMTGLDNKMAADKVGYGFGQAGSGSLYAKGQSRQNVGFTSAALIYANNVNGLTVKNVTVKNALSAGIVTKGISENVTIDSSIFEDLGDAAIRIGNGAYSGTTYTKGLVITNNYVTNIGLFDKAAVAVQSCAVANAQIVGNTVVNVPYSAFSFGWIWSTIDQTAENIIGGGAFSTFNMEIAYNYITDCMTCTGDGGPIYLLGGNVKREANDATAYNFMHHNYANMSEATGLHGNNATSKRFAMGYYHDNSSSNWIDYENVLINTSTGTFNAWYMQHIEDCEAQNIKLINNYHIGVGKTANGYNMQDVYTNGKVVNADFGIVANDYVYENVTALKNNTSIGVQTYANATTKESPANASTIVAGIFAAAGSDLAPEAKVSGLSWTAPAVDRVVLMDADIADVSGFEGVEVHSVTFTDGERTTVTQGVAGVKVAVPAIFAEDGYTYEFSVDGVVVDPAEIVIGDADITVNVKVTVKTYTLLIKDGMQTVELVLPYGEKVAFPEEFFKTGYTTTFTTTDGEVLDADNFTMPATDLEVRATYALEKHMVTFTDVNGVKYEFYSTYGANVPMPTTKFTAPFGHTTKYFVDGVEVKSLTVPTSDLAVEVRYVPNTYDVKFINKIGATETAYETIQIVFGQAITLPAAPEAFEVDGYRYSFVGWLGYTEGMILETEGATFYTEWTAEEIKPDVPELAAGDINGDGVVDIADIVAVINKASGAELDATEYPGEPDINADGVVDIADIVAVINIASGSAS